MKTRILCLLVLFVTAFGVRPSSACCAVGSLGEPVVNADQTVIIIWDPATKRQHFVRRASFKSEGEDFAFLVPTPSRPELSESGDAAFGTLRRITAPAVGKAPLSFSLGCSAAPPSDVSWVRVVEEKSVAGFHATVLEAGSATALTAWLRAHGYPFSSAVEEWARPYIGQGWMITAMKVEKEQSGQTDSTVNASALRISFRTERPLFPYREPESKTAARKLGASDRLLRLYFLSDKRYDGALDGGAKWSGKTVWSGRISAEDRTTLLGELGLPASTGPAAWHLTEFEDRWPYAKASGDLYFSPAASQKDVARQEVEKTGDVTLVAFGVLLVCFGLLRRVRP